MLQTGVTESNVFPLSYTTHRYVTTRQLPCHQCTPCVFPNSSSIGVPVTRFHSAHGGRALGRRPPLMEDCAFWYADKRVLIPRIIWGLQR